MIIANTPDVISSDKTQVQIKSKDSDWVAIRSASKDKVSQKIILLIENLR